MSASIPRMQRSALEEFVAAPLGRFAAGRTWIVFAPRADLRGHAVWGRPSTEEMVSMVRGLHIAAQPGDTPHRWLVDLRGLQFIDPRQFKLMVDFVASARPMLTRNILRQAQLRPDGMLGAIIEGFSAVARLSYEQRVFDDLPSASDWLGLERTECMELLSQLDAIRAELTENEFMLRVRRALDEDPRRSLGALARQLGHSVRSLQRLLGESGATFRAEQQSALVRRAEALLGQPEAKVAAVAEELGFGTPNQFTATFRRLTGESPSEWRQRHLEALHSGASRRA